MQTNSYGQPVRLTLAMLLSVWMLTSSLSAQKEITASEAKNHIGETATVCGTVASTRFARINERPTHIPQSRSAISQSNLYSAYLGQRSQQVWETRSRLSEHPDLRDRENIFLSRYS